MTDRVPGLFPVVVITHSFFFFHFPFESIWSDHRRRIQKIWTDEQQQPIWRLMQKETLPGLSMRDNLGQQNYIKERRACGQKRCGTGHCEIKSEEFSRLTPGSTLNRSRQLKLVKGCNEFVMSSLVIGQLHVSRPDHHNHIHSSFLGCFRFCSDRRTGEHTILNLILFYCEVN